MGITGLIGGFAENIPGLEMPIRTIPTVLILAAVNTALRDDHLGIDPELSVSPILQ
jgi:hypothetical protein